MDFVDIFCGIGTIRMGMEKAGHQCIYSIEWDKYKRTIYKTIFGEEPSGSDIAYVQTNDIPESDCWCFGFPCTDISIAGNKKGLSGDRSGLFFTVCQLLREKKNKPRILLIENVKNLFSVNNGWDFYRILIELDEIGYDAEWELINSAEVVPQNRERVYIVGHLREKPWNRVFPIGKNAKLSYKTCEKKKEVSPCLRAKSGGSDIDEVYISNNGKWRSLTWQEKWRLQSIPETIIQKVSESKISKTRLCIAAGDACTVDVIYEIAKKLY